MPTSFQRRRLHPDRQGHPGQARLARDFAKMEEQGGWRTAITPDLAGFLAECRSLYLATASADGQPYVQHRGGPPGFVRVLDERTLGFADFKGNRQYITTGNLAENRKAFIFVMDYAQRRRVKLWGRARVVEGDAALLARLWPEGYQARPEQVIVFEVEAWDTNCPQHIPQMFHAEDVAQTIQQFQARIRERSWKARGCRLPGRAADARDVEIPHPSRISAAVRRRHERIWARTSGGDAA